MRGIKKLPWLFSIESDPIGLMNRASIRTHSSEVEVGLAKMACKVLVCLAFMRHTLSKNDSVEKYCLEVAWDKRMNQSRSEPVFGGLRCAKPPYSG